MNGLAASRTTDSARIDGHALTLADISHYYGQTPAVLDANLDIGAGELVSLLGPSGCGKTTLLRIIAGFINPTRGDILVDGQSIRGLPANRRRMGIVFQNYALFPHMTIFENVAYGLRARREDDGEIRKRVTEMLELIQLPHLAERFPKQLSGGQQQRVALARALATRPRILLLDEPLSALDKNLRLDMQIEIKRIQREFGVTTIMVTHDQEEAMTMSDRIAVIDNGLIQQFDRPTTIYDSPANMFVNEFIGMTNILPATFLEATTAGARVRIDDGTVIDCDRKVDLMEGASVALSIRPEGLRIGGDGGAGQLKGWITIAMPVGPSVIYDVQLAGGHALKVETARTDQIHKEGEAVSLVLGGGNTLSIFPANKPDTEA